MDIHCDEISLTHSSQYRALIAELNYLWQHPLSGAIREAELVPYLRAASAKGINPQKPKTVR